jgi:hypothetical protein
MMTLEKLTLNGATTLLSYLQQNCLDDSEVGAIALAGALCEMLNQLELAYPGITENYGWERTITPQTESYPRYRDFSPIESDRYPDFPSSHVS